MTGFGAYRTRTHTPGQLPGRPAVTQSCYGGPSRGVSSVTECQMMGSSENHA